MAQNVPLVLRLVASSVTAANRAGKIIRDVMSRGDLGIVEKGKNDLQTEADRSAQGCIMASLSRQYPSVSIIGEEGSSNCEVPSDWVVTDCDQSILSLSCPTEYLQVVDNDVTVWVDPLDGTSEYTQGLLSHVTVLIGIAVNGKAVGGVIHQPYHKYSGDGQDAVGRTFWGLVGLGVGGFEAQDPPAGKLHITTTRSHSSDIVNKAIEIFNPDKVIRVGGAGHKVMLLLEGEAHAYIYPSRGTKRWDTCAPEAILTASGGRLSDIFGNLYDYSKNVNPRNMYGIIATAKDVDHSSFIKKISQDVKDHLVM